MQINNQNGFTLIEIIITFTILTIVVTGMLTFFSQAYSYTTKNQNKTIAINVARGASAFMKNQDFTELKGLFSATSSCSITDTDSNGLNELTLYVGILNDLYHYRCSPFTQDNQIVVNDTVYQASVVLEETNELIIEQNDSSDGTKAFLLPFTVYVMWENRGEQQISLEGAIVDEALR